MGGSLLMSVPKSAPLMGSPGWLCSRDRKARWDDESIQWFNKNIILFNDIQWWFRIWSWNDFASQNLKAHHHSTGSQASALDPLRLAVQGQVLASVPDLALWQVGKSREQINATAAGSCHLESDYWSMVTPLIWNLPCLMTETKAGLK